ncbi:MAG: methyltransferase domain-containing protein [Planctomycetota bacterium]
MSESLPFWERGYADPTAEVFGSAPSEDVVACASFLPRGARVLDAGCGEGRNALWLASQGHCVDAVDISTRGIAKLLSRAGQAGLEVRAWVGDLSNLDLDGEYDLIVCHGVLHLLHKEPAVHAVRRFQAHTRQGGANVICVFTNRVPCPPDLVAITPALWGEGELPELYAGWRMTAHRAYVFEDDHPGGVHHTHAAERVTAWKQGTGSCAP